MKCIRKLRGLCVGATSLSNSAGYNDRTDFNGWIQSSWVSEDSIADNETELVKESR